MIWIIRILVSPITGVVKVLSVATEVAFAGALANLIVGILIAVLFLGAIGIGLEYLGNQAENLIKMAYPAYETSTERNLRIQAEKKRREEQIFGSLNKWLDKWYQQKLPYVVKQYRFYPYNAYAVKDGDIWVLGKICSIDNWKHVISAIFHSQNNGADWEISWQQPKDRYWGYVRLREINITDKQQVSVLFYTVESRPRFSTLHTIDGGKNWQIH